METFGCSFFVHSGWATGSNNNAVGVAVTAESCVKRRRSRGRRKRPARRNERAESCEDGVMVATSPLTAKVGLWDAAGEKREGETLALERNVSFFLFFCPASKDDFKNGFVSPTFNSSGPPALSPAKREEKEKKKR